MSDDVREPRGIGWGYVIYRQVAGVLGAFGLAAFLGHFMHLDWRGALSSLVGVWAQVVRPATKWILDLALMPLTLRCHCSFVVPPVLTDYVSAGAVLALSTFRSRGPARRMLYTRLDARQARIARQVLSHSEYGWFSFVMDLLGAIFNVALWPVVTAVLGLQVLMKLILMMLFFRDPRETPVSHLFFYEDALTLLPMIYLALLLAANYLLLKPGS